jgi:hypothetical protein
VIVEMDQVVKDRRTANAASLEERLRAWSTVLERHQGSRPGAGAGSGPGRLVRPGTARPDALDGLTAAFGLAPLEAGVLLAAAASELDGAIAAKVARLDGELSDGAPTVHLVLDRLVPEPDERLLALDVLLPAAPLVRYRLVRPGDGPGDPRPAAARPLRVDGRMVDYLRGVDRLDDRLAGALRPLPPALIAPDHDALVATLAGWLEHATSWPVVNLLGSADSGARDVAMAAADRLGLGLLEVDLERLGRMAPSERAEVGAVAGREAILSRLALLVDAGDLQDPATAETASAARELVDSVACPVIVISRDRWPVLGGASAMVVPRPGRAARHGIWTRALARVPNVIDGELDGIVEQFDLGPAGIGRALDGAVRARPAERSGDPLDADELWEACRLEGRSDLDDLARPVRSDAGWPDIVLPDDALAQLHELADQIASRPQVYERWGFGARLSRGRGIAALFAGPSGTGKTLAAEILANELRLDIVRIDLAAVVSKYIGETEKNLRRVFDAAERSGVVLLFDEADALFGNRTEVRDSHDRYANIEVNYLLQRMEDHTGLAILATNRKDAIDEAFLRRLRFVIDFPFPSLDDRRRIWAAVFPPQAEVGTLDVPFLARLELNGASIRSIALNAAFMAASRGGLIEMTEVVRAARRELTKLGRPISAAEFGPYHGLVR